MSELTITEALAELKLIDKKIAKKQEFILGYLLRQAIARDPLEKSGGSVTAIAAERQSIDDLQENKLRIRRAIQDANSKTVVAIGGASRSISDWLVWRREVAPKEKQLLSEIGNRIRSVRDGAMKKGGQFGMQQPDDLKSEHDIVVNARAHRSTIKVCGNPPRFWPISEMGRTPHPMRGALRMAAADRRHL